MTASLGLDGLKMLLFIRKEVMARRSPAPGIPATVAQFTPRHPRVIRLAIGNISLILTEMKITIKTTRGS